MTAAREAIGLSRRAFARQVHTSHTNLADYEHGRRLPPDWVVQVYERELNLPTGELMNLVKQARSQPSRGAAPEERTERQFPTAPGGRRWFRRRYLGGGIILTGALVLIAFVVTTVVLNRPPTTQPSLPAGRGLRDVCAWDLRVRPAPDAPGDFGKLLWAQKFDVEQLNPTGVWAYGFAYGDVNREGWVIAKWLGNPTCPSPSPTR